MKCPECGFELNDNEVYCENCGAEIVAALPSSPDGEKQGNVKNRKKNADNKGASKLKLGAAIIGTVAAIAVIVTITVCVVNAVKASEGRKIFEKVPLGRDISMIESDTGTTFLSGESSAYGALNHIADYNYICESEKSVTVDGIMLPEWAVLLRDGSAGSVGEAVLYNFTVIKHSWMGTKTASKLELSAVEYGTSIKAAERAIGLKPYTIVKESTENTSTYVYRYHYVDDESGNNCVMNFYVIVSDVDNQVKDVRDEQLDYLNLIFRT